MNSDDMLLWALESLTETYSLFSVIDHMSLVKSTWHHLKAFPGAAGAIISQEPKVEIRVSLR